MSWVLGPKGDVASYRMCHYRNDLNLEMAGIFVRVGSGLELGFQEAGAQRR